jgi:hypothetical protein
MKSYQKAGLAAFIICLSVAMIPLAGAKLSIGSATGVKAAQALPGETVSFKILLFNAHEDPAMHVRMESEQPRGWIVDIEPDEFDLPISKPGDTAPEAGYEIVGTAEGDVKARPVTATIKVPGYSAQGNYEIKVLASAGKQGGVLSMSLVRSFYFGVEVSGAGPGQAPQSQQRENSGKAGFGQNQSNSSGQATGNETHAERGTTAHEGANATNATLPESQPPLTGMLPGAGPYACILLAVFTIAIISACWFYYRRE